MNLNFHESLAHKVTFHSIGLHGQTGYEENPIAMYHQTSRYLGPIIMKSEFHHGHYGWCGPAIYFAKTPQATYRKAIGNESHSGFIIKAYVKLGKWIRVTKDHCGDPEVRMGLLNAGFTAFIVNPGDGDEWLIFHSQQVVKMEKQFEDYTKPMNAPGEQSVDW